MKGYGEPLIEAQREELDRLSCTHLVDLVKVLCDRCDRIVATVSDTIVETQDGDEFAKLGALVQGKRRNPAIDDVVAIRKVSFPRPPTMIVPGSSLWLAQLDRSTTPPSFPLWCSRCREKRPPVRAGTLQREAARARTQPKGITLRR